MKAGDTVRFDCEDCSTEFEVTLEPKEKGNPKTDDKPVTACPFCGSMTGVTVTDTGLPDGKEDED